MPKGPWQCYICQRNIIGSHARAVSLDFFRLVRLHLFVAHAVCLGAGTHAELVQAPDGPDPL